MVAASAAAGLTPFSEIAVTALSTTGDRLASTLGQLSWAMFDFARIPFVLLMTIYVFAPYFANTVVAHDPVRGQAMWGDIQAISGFIIAIFAPFIGAMSDAGGRRKPWIASLRTADRGAKCAALVREAGSTGISLFEVGALVAVLRRRLRIRERLLQCHAALDRDA